MTRAFVSTDVLVVGAGPTGLVTAALLERLGVSTRILDPYTSRLAVPKAHVLGPVSLDVCAQAGFDVDAIRAAARPMGTDRWVSFRTTLFGKELSRLPFEYQSTEWTARPRVNIAQPQFEAILENEVRARASVDYVTGRWISMQQDGERVVSTATVDGEEVQLVSRYLLAADGARSAVRAALGIANSPFGPSSQSLSVHLHADLRDWLDDPTIVLTMNTDPSAPGGFILYDPGREATFATFDVGEREFTDEQATELVRTAFGRDDVPFAVRGTAKWEMAAEVADSFRAGGVFLLGDAAHRLPPTGGLGMNSGIQDGANLAWKIAAVLAGWAGDALLDTYEAERRRIAITYTSQSSANNAAHQRMREAVGGAPEAADIERITEEQWVGFNCPGLQLGYGYAPGQDVTDPGHYTPSAQIGRRLPHTIVGRDDAARPIVDLVDRSGFTLLTQGRLDEWATLVTAAAVPIAVLDLDRLVTDTEWLELTGLATPGAAIVVRPDAHIIARCSRPEAWPNAEQALADHAEHGATFAVTASFRDYVPPPGHPRYTGLDQDIRTYSDRTIERLDEAGLIAPFRQAVEVPFTGVTSDGVRRPGLFPVDDDGAPTAEAMAAAHGLVTAASGEQQSQLIHPLDSANWAKWSNPEIYLYRHGLRLDELAEPTREAIMTVVRASLSPQGYAKARDSMRMNAFLGTVMGAPRILNEYSYNFTIFGTPSETEPWGWQLTGHHLVLNCLFAGKQMVISPFFFGAEPNQIDGGPRAGMKILTAEEDTGLAVVNGLRPELRARAVLYEDAYGPDVPTGRVHPVDHLHLAGMGRDNRIIPYEGLPLKLCDQTERELALRIVDAYTRHLPEGPRQARVRAIREHLPETWFCWIGGSGPADPFYYRLQSPVALFEFDHHPGVFLTNERAEKFHIHTLGRTPNGNDYGMELRNPA